MGRIFKTEQELFWAGEFGNEYNTRNKGEELLASNISFFNRALQYAIKPKTCIEFGANIGMNLKALKNLYPKQEQFAIEINKEAIDNLHSFLPSDHIFNISILDYSPEKKFELVLIKGVLIHICPDFLQQVYDSLYHSTNRYLLIAEYYNPTPIQIQYRGHCDRLFKRDFCGEILDRFSNLQLIDYGFVYNRDPNYPQDDITWFLLKKEE